MTRSLSNIFEKRDLFFFLEEVSCNPSSLKKKKKSGKINHLKLTWGCSFINVIELSKLHLVTANFPHLKSSAELASLYGTEQILAIQGKMKTGIF